ncbi:Hsp20/alpha crystallin family protein [Streptomyces regalis]|uniref:Heat-shock protein Hsp20 n=1 Tax=Streptomyces regalis TaxID=68262 RepID=A0A117MKD5_9ACTN|nr:Hsp20/alpha crystallin family protein [Streptomyces regalis]KUL22196.1 heat-shock protein Hsp20 [Streptomyces regalis]
MTLPVRRGRGALPMWDPFREIEDLRTRMDQLMRSTFPFPGAGFLEAGKAEMWAPLADVEDTEDAYLVELELPGVEKDQLTVEVAEGELDVHGEIKEKERTGVVRHHARHIGQFDFRTSLPSNCDTEHISADLTNGVLTVRVPKAERARPQRIEISG